MVSWVSVYEDRGRITWEDLVLQGSRTYRNRNLGDVGESKKLVHSNGIVVVKPNKVRPR